jgi:hypothetical protein
MNVKNAPFHNAHQFHVFTLIGGRHNVICVDGILEQGKRSIRVAVANLCVSWRQGVCLFALLLSWVLVS